MSGRATAANVQSAGSRRRMRDQTALRVPPLASEAAISEPAMANMTPMAGSTQVSQAQPNAW